MLCSQAYGQLNPSVLPNLPASLKWNQIVTPHFKIIYAEGFEKQAQKSANIFENIYGPASQTLGAQPIRFPIILQNYHSSSNGFVTISPYRSELYTLAPQGYQFLGNDQWMEKLIAHEYRHIVQFQKALTPFNKGMYFLFGEYGAGFWAGLAAPSWFFEGDAVGLETAMGRTGRGRAPNFLMSFKTNTIEKGGFHYYKQHLNSFRDFVPNHYVTGYLMTTHLKNEHGPDIWNHVTQNAFSKPFIPFTFSNSIKKETGKYLVATYDEMLEDQKDLYKKQLDSFVPTPFEKINKEEKEIYVHYRFPRPLPNGEVFALKSGLGDIPQFVRLDQKGEEKVIHQLGPFLNNEYLSTNDSIVVWIESTFDPRWERRSFLDIKKLNFQNGQLTTLTKKERYTAAAISKDGSKIITTHQDNQSQHSLRLLDAKNGSILMSFDNPLNSFYTMPQFSFDENSIVLLRHTGAGKEVVTIDLQSRKEQIIYSSTNENIGHPVIIGEYLYYNSTYNGIDNIYARHITSKKDFLVTQAKYGAFNPAFTSDGHMLYNDFFVDGFNIAKIKLDTSFWIPKEKVMYIGTRFEDKMVENENISDILYNSPDETYPTKKYKRLPASIRPTGWGLTLSPNTFSEGGLNEISVGIQSRDLLSTTLISGQATYNTAEDVWRYGFDVSYQGLYPILEVGGDFGSRSVRLSNSNGSTTQYFWNENTWTAGLRIPLNLTNSKYSKKLIFGSNAEISQVSDYSVPATIIDQSENGMLYSLKTSARFSRLLRRTKLDLRSRWGQTFELHSFQTPFGGDYSGNLMAGETNLYFPGIFKHHSIAFRASYQIQDIDSYFFESPISYTRGFGYNVYENYSNYSLNYALPLATMDWHVGPILNLQRIYTNAFYDFGLGQNEGNPNDQLMSFGAEVSLNFNLMRFLLLLDVGVRYSYRPELNSGVTELIIGPISF